jgi:exosortase K
MNKNIPYYLIAIGLFVLLKFWIGTFDNNQLIFLLIPTDKIFELVTGTQSEYNSEIGFFYDKLNIVIDKSCSGYNFLLLCFVMLYFQLVKYAKQFKFKLVLLFGSLSIAYFLTILINSSRIIISVVFQNVKFDFWDFEPHILHESIGVLTYLSFLLITYYSTEKILNKRYAQLTKS